MTTRSALRTITRVLAAPAAACVAVAALASPAAAARPDSTSTVRSGADAFVNWVEQDPDDLLGLPGNVHVGHFGVERGVFGNFAFGQIFDYQCDPGEVPGDHGAPSACDEVGVRFLDGSSGQLTTSERTATYTGTIVVSNGGHGDPGSVLAEVPATITWTSSTALARYRETFTHTERGISFRSRTTGLRSDVQATTVTGALGRMGFTDDADDEAQGQFRTYTEVSRERIRG